MYAKGLEITFTNYLIGIVEKDVSSTSLFEDSLGTNGNGVPIIVQAEIYGRRNPTKQKNQKCTEESTYNSSVSIL